MHYIKKEFIRVLRKESTEEEKKGWDILRSRQFENMKSKVQHI
ncbi:MAG: DUF559 domain-containing protein, partial [Candidatus Hodarchaeales archaeon]